MKPHAHDPGKPDPAFAGVERAAEQALVDSIGTAAPGTEPRTTFLGVGDSPGSPLGGSPGSVMADPSLLAEILPLAVEFADEAGQDLIRRAALKAGLGTDWAAEHASRVAMRSGVKTCGEKCLALLARKYGVASEWSPEIALAIVGLAHLSVLRSALAAIRSDAEKVAETKPQNAEK